MRILFFLAIFWGTLPFFFLDPFYGVIHYSLINIIRPEQLMWGYRGGRIFLAAQAVCFTSWLVNREKLLPQDNPTPRQLKVMYVIIVGMLLSTLFSITPEGLSWKWTFQFMRTVLFCFVMSKSINTTKKLELYYAATLTWFMLLQMWGIQQNLGGNARMEGLGGEQLGDVNDLAAVAVLYFPMAYYSLFSSKKWMRLGVGVPTTIVSVIFIIFGGSRGAFLGLAACIMLIFLRTPGVQKFKMAFAVGIIGILLGAILSALAPEGFFDEYTARLKTMLGEEDVETGQVERESSAAGRFAMWKASYYFMKQHPEFWLSGLGMRGFSAVYFSYIDDIAPYLTNEELGHIVYGGTGGKAIHSSYINVITSGGLIVFLPWAYLYFFSWRQMRSIPKYYPKIVDGVDLHNYARAVEVGLFGAAVSIAFINAEFVDFYYWHITMAGILLNLAKAKLRREELGQEDEEFPESSVKKGF